MTASVSLATAGQRFTAAWINGNLPQAWSPCTFNGAWANQGARANMQVRYETAVTVRIVGAVVPGTMTSGFQFANLPSGFAPLSQVVGYMGIVSGTGTGTTIPIWIYSTGKIGLTSAALTAGATEVDFNCVYPLDI